MYTFDDFCEGGFWNTGLLSSRKWLIIFLKSREWWDLPEVWDRENANERNTSLLLDHTWPQLTPCFISFIRIWIPCFYVWVLLPYFILGLKGNKGDGGSQENTRQLIYEDTSVTYQVWHGDQQTQTHRNHRQMPVENCVPIPLVTALKIAFVSLQAVVSAIELIRSLSTESGLLDILSGFILLVTYILLCFMLWFEKRKQSASSSFIFFYFFLMFLVFGAPRIYMSIFIWGVEDEVFPFTNVMILYGLNLACLVLTFFGDNTTVNSRQDYKPIGRPECPEQTSTYPAQILFTWMRGLMITGFRHDLTYDDVWKINPRDSSRQLSPRFEELWAEETERARKKNKRRKSVTSERNGTKINNSSVLYSSSHENAHLLDRKGSIQSNQVGKILKGNKAEIKPSLFLVMVRMMWKEAMIGLLQRTVGDTFLYMGPLILGALINFLQNYDESKVWQAYALSVLLFVTGLIRSFLFAQSMYAGSLIGLKTKTTLTTAIYKKALTISGASKKNSTVGEIVNLMSVDCQRLQEMMAMFLFTWSTPFQIIMATILLYQTLGVSTFAGVLVMAISVPINHRLSEKQRVLQTDILDLKDNRIRLVNEIINGMKVLKFYAWEMEFKKKVELIRKMEISQLYKIANVFISLNTLAGLMPFLVGLFTFTTYVLIDRDNVLDANKAFVSLSLFNLLRVPMIYIATAIVYMVQSTVCIKRINNFLNLEDLDPSTVSHDINNKFAVEIKSGAFSWDKNEQPTLHDINMEVPEGSLVAIIGPIGSGKSSLVSAILGDIQKNQGHVNVKGRVAYVSQQAWIQNSTVRDNIVFGDEFDRRRYNATVTACQLLSDFEILDGGDQTEIGEKGINISGGQKQRINLARAAYSQSEIFLLDDPLSAVDAHVGKDIFEQLIGPGGYLDGKTRILVTHGLQWLSKVDKIFVLSDGRISDQGSYKELIKSSKHFSELINLYTTESRVQPDILINTKIDVDQFGQLQKKAQVDREQRDLRKLSEPTKFQDSFDFETSCSQFNSIKSIHPESARLTQIETLEKGKISTEVYTTFIKASGPIALVVAFICYTLFNAFLILSNFWLAEWTEESILLNDSTRTSDEAISAANYYLLIYGLFGVGQVVMHLLYCVLYWHAMVRASKQLHSLLLERLFHAPMSFFDQTPVGRILNRFSRDVDIVDNNLPLIIKDLTLTAFWVLGTICVVMIQTPVFGLVLIPLFVGFMIAQNFYVRTSRQLKRMESIARSPVYTHFSETVTGASIIRAYGVTERFIDESEDKLDENQVYYFASQGAIRWLQLNLDVLSNLVVLFAALLQVLGGGGGSDAGLSVTYALQITGIMTYMVRQVCEFETNIVCVERMKEYSQIEQEAGLSIPSAGLASDWPSEGNVEFCDYQLRYRPGLQLVLKGVNCSIRKAEKVGIVGRTGAGKSSLTLALFRIIEAAGGLIQVDGINIAKIGLHDLRKKLTILPQDPVLFSGSLRMNIDPFDEFTDDKLWLALEHSHLKDFVAGQPDGLMYECGEEGTNLSVGQRQLVCLARALLRKTKILILDEATAAVDMETDALIQATIRKAFHDCTILAIAHRLQTIMDYDRVIVMDVGMVKEFDSPERLIQQQGIFYDMCKDAGLA